MLGEIFAGIALEWSLSVDEIAYILNRPQDNLDTSLGEDDISRALDIMNIYSNVCCFFIDKEERKAWIRTPSDSFGKMSPMDLIRAHPENLKMVKSIVSTFVVY